MITLMFLGLLAVVMLAIAAGSVIAVGAVSAPLLIIAADITIAVFTIWSIVRLIRWLFGKREVNKK